MVAAAAAGAAATIVTVRYCRRRVVVQVASIDFTISMTDEITGKDKKFVDASYTIYLDGRSRAKFFKCALTRK